MVTGRGTATGCGTLRTTTTTTAPLSSPVSTGTGPSSLPGSILRLSTAMGNTSTSTTQQARQFSCFSLRDLLSPAWSRFQWLSDILRDSM